VQTLTALDNVDFTQILRGHGQVLTKDQLTFFKGYLTDLIAAVKKAAAGGGSLEGMKKTLPDPLALRSECAHC